METFRRREAKGIRTGSIRLTGERVEEGKVEGNRGQANDEFN